MMKPDHRHGNHMSRESLGKKATRLAAQLMPKRRMHSVTIPPTEKVYTRGGARSAMRRATLPFRLAARRVEFKKFKRRPLGSPRYAKPVMVSQAAVVG